MCSRSRGLAYKSPRCSLRQPPNMPDSVTPLHDSLMGLIKEHRLSAVLDKSRLRRARAAKKDGDVYKWAISLRSLLAHIGQRMHQAIKEKKGSQANKTLPKNDITASTRRATWSQFSNLSHKLNLAIGASGPMAGLSDGEASTASSDSECEK